jgi:hypothetical protein
MRSGTLDRSARQEPMRDWSPKDAIALERRHIVEGEQRVARQEMLLRQVTAWGRENLIDDATEVLRLLREAVDLSRVRLRDLEDRYPRRP